MKNKSFLTLMVSVIMTLIIVLGAFGMMSCSKDTETNIDSTPKNLLELPDNPNNFLDSIGIKHNIHLNAVLSIINNEFINPNNLSADAVLEIYRKYLLDNNYAVSDIDFAFEIIKNGYDLSENVKNQLSSLQNSISIIPNVSYANYKQIICRYEKNLIEDSTLNASERRTLLAYTSVLRHSMYYWYENPSKAIPNWLKIAGADAAGAATGMAGGALLGWPGAIICGVLAGTGSSLEKAEELEKLEKPVDTISNAQNKYRRI